MGSLSNSQSWHNLEVFLKSLRQEIKVLAKYLTYIYQSLTKGEPQGLVFKNVIFLKLAFLFKVRVSQGFVQN